MKTPNIGLILAMVGGLVGCASPVVYEGKFARDDGWYKGKILQIGPAQSLKRPAYYDCRKTDPDASSAQDYALIAFRRNGHPYARIAPVEREAGFKRGEPVYVNIRNCNAAVSDRSS